MNSAKADLCNFLISARQRAGLSQLDVSKALGYKSPQFISNNERGISLPATDTLADLAKILKVDVVALIRRIHDVKKEELENEMAGLLAAPDAKPRKKVSKAPKGRKVK